MNNEWTESDRERAKSNIQKFSYNCAIAVNMFIDTHLFLFDSLGHYWASPKAKDFSANFRQKFVEIMDVINNRIVNTIKHAQYAFNNCENAKELEPIYDIENSYYQQINTIKYNDSNSFSLCEMIGNLQGMNIEAIRNRLIPEYKTRMESVINKVDSLPLTIDLYTYDNGAQYTYATGVNNLVNELQALFNYLIREVEIALDYETDELFSARKTANDLLESARI